MVRFSVRAETTGSSAAGQSFFPWPRSLVGGKRRSLLRGTRPMPVGTLRRHIQGDLASTTQAEEQLRELLYLHFHPQHGSEYWLRRQDILGWDVCDRVRTQEDLWLLGP